MRRLTGAWAIGLAMGLAAGQPTRPQPPRDAVRVEAPIREVDLSDGERRYTVSIQIGSTPVEAGLDSGSTGLRVLPGVIAEGQAQASGRRVTYSYDSGAKLDGVLGQATVSIGNPALSAPAPLQLVQSVGCRAEKPRCPASRVPLAQYGIQGNGLPGEGFKAIIGVNMGPDDAANPLMRLGARRWIIELPRPGDPAPGRLILNPTAEEVAGYLLFPIDPQFSDRHGGLHDAIKGCLINRNTNRSFCGPALLDTGAPGLRIVTPARESPWPDGAPGRIVFIDNGKPALAADFVVGRRDQASHLTMEAEPRAPAARLFLGLAPYFGFSALYDPQAGMIGLKAR